MLGAGMIEDTHQSLGRRRKGGSSVVLRVISLPRYDAGQFV
jgi:hypothetical protein